MQDLTPDLLPDLRQGLLDLRSAAQGHRLGPPPARPQGIPPGPILLQRVEQEMELVFSEVAVLEPEPVVGANQEVPCGRHVNKNAHAPLVSRALEAAQGDRTVATPRIGDGLLFAGDRPLRRLPLPARTDNVKGRNGDRLGLYRCRVRHAAGTCPAPATIMARVLDPYVEQVLPRRAEPDALTTQPYVMDQHLVEVVPRKGD